MRNTKIKTSGLTSILKFLGYKTNVVVNHISHGYKTILVAMREDVLFEVHLTLKESLFGDSKVLVRMYNMKKDYESIIEKVVDTSDRQTVAKSIIKTIESANKESILFTDRMVRMMFISLVNARAVKEYYSAEKQIYKFYDLVNTAKW
jgi:hypothetical protein